jgi:glycosyltransferase involved in cell wall biosynthesis
MRITYIHQHYRRPQMPGGTRSHEFASHLAQSGHHVTVITSWQETLPPAVCHETVAGYNVRWIHIPYSNTMGYWRRVSSFVQFLLAASWHASRTPADLVFATSTPLTVVIPGAVGAWVHRVPWVLEIRDLWPEVPIAIGAIRNPLAKWFARWLARFGYRSAARVITLSPGIRDGVIRAGCSPNKVSVIPNLSNLAAFGDGIGNPDRFLERYPALRGRPIVMYAGTIGQVNGVDYLVKIAAKAMAHSSKVAFCILGEGRELPQLRQVAASMGVLDSNLIVCPPLTKSQMPDALAAARLCTSLVVDLPAMWDNSANKFFDALAAGRPIAINYEGWQAELIRSTGVGLVLPADDAPSAWRIIEGFLSDEEGVIRAGQGARSLALERFDAKRLAAEFELVLLEAAARPGQDQDGCPRDL